MIFEDVGHDAAARLGAHFSPRARGPVRRAAVLAAGLLGGAGEDADSLGNADGLGAATGPDAHGSSAGANSGLAGLGAEVLSETPRSIVLRFFTPAPGRAGGISSVVAKHFRRRDGASNSGGFGYLRALWGARMLPGAARVLAVDEEHRLILSEDLGDLPGLDAGLEDRPEAGRDEGPASGPSAGLNGPSEPEAEVPARWIRAWPELCLPAGSEGFERFCVGLAAADAVAARRGDAGVMASKALLRRGLSAAQAEELTRRDAAVLWWGDPSPRNIRWDARSETPAGRFRQVDLEGAGWCSPALLVAEVRQGLPQAVPFREQGWLPPAQYRELSAELAEAWRVPERHIRLAEEGLGGILRELRGLPNAPGSS